MGFDKNALILAKSCFGEKNCNKNYIWFHSGIFILFRMDCIMLHEPITVQGRQGMENVNL